MTVYLLTRRGVLHKGTRTEAGLQVYESDNLDAAIKEVEYSAEPPHKRKCRRCFREAR